MLLSYGRSPLKSKVVQQTQLRDNRIKANIGEMRAGVDTSCNIQIELFPVFGRWYKHLTKILDFNLFTFQAH